MFTLKSLLIAATALPTVLAHYKLIYPSWRGDSFADGASQWVFPCANITQTTSADNRTEWPLTGGSLKFSSSHPSALTYINIGLGNEVVSFNVSVLDRFNQTGNGTLCLHEIAKSQLASLGVKNGDNATVQVIQIGHTGGALYNCADIMFSDKAQLLPDDQCQNSTGVGGVEIVNAGEQTASPSPSAKPNAAKSVDVTLSRILLAGMVTIGLNAL